MCDRRFRKHVGLPEIECTIVDKMPQRAVPDEDLLELLDIDFRWLFPKMTGITILDQRLYRNALKVLTGYSPEGIRNEVKVRISDLGRNGGYVITACHNTGADIPVENLEAMYGAIKECKESS